MNEENKKQVADRLSSPDGRRQPAEYTVELAAALAGNAFSLPGGLDVRECLVLTDSEGGWKAAFDAGAACVFYCPLLKNMGETAGAEWVVESAEGLDFEFLDRLYRRHHHLPWVIAVTERCRIREMTTEDLDRLYDLYGEPSIAEHVEPLFEERREEEEFTKAYIRNMYGFYGFGLWIVEERERGGIIGRAGLSFRDGYEDLEIGYMISEKYRGRGYAEEACQAVMDYAVRELSCRALNAFVEEKNGASVRLCRKLGFVRHSEVKMQHKGSQRKFVRYVWRREN